MPDAEPSGFDDSPVGTEPDRRWYPIDDPAEWARSTRAALFDMIQNCVRHSIGSSIRDDATSSELAASDDVFRRLHACAQSSAKTLYGYGQAEDQVVSVVLAAAASAAEPEQLHPAVLRAVEEWCREAGTPPNAPGT